MKPAKLNISPIKSRLARLLRQPGSLVILIIVGIITLPLLGYAGYTSYTRYHLTQAYDALNLALPYQLKTQNYIVHNLSPATPTLQYVYSIDAPADQPLSNLSRQLQEKGFIVDYRPNTVAGRLDATKPADHLHVYVQADKDDTHLPQGIDSLNPHAKTLGIMIFHEN